MNRMSLKFQSSQELKPRRYKKEKGLVNQSKELYVMINTGEVIIGVDKVIQELSLGELKLIVIANNIPIKTRKKIDHYVKCLKEPVKIYTINNTSWELGTNCGKPYWISALGIKDFGRSSFLDLIDEEIK